MADKTYITLDGKYQLAEGVLVDTSTLTNSLSGVGAADLQTILEAIDVAITDSQLQSEAYAFFLKSTGPT
jgi:hypothetical protein